MKLIKRIIFTFIAFIIASLFVTLWQNYMPINAISGAIMAVIAVGSVIGTWSWSKK